MTSRSLPTLPLLATCALASCSVTAWLWEDSQEAPPLERTDTLCRIRGVDGNFVDPKGDDSVAVSFTVEREFDTPRILAAMAEDQKQRLVLRPRPEDPNWMRLPGAARFQPKMWQFDVFRGTYFRDETASVPLVFLGAMRPDSVGELIDAPTEVSPYSGLDGHDVDAVHHPLARAAYDSLKREDWVRLLGGAENFTEREVTPVAWVDGKGRMLDPEKVQELLRRGDLDAAQKERIADYSIVARLESGWGRPLYVRVAVPVLVQGKDLKLLRSGTSIVWQRRQIWQAWHDDAPTRDPEAWRGALQDELVARAAAATPLLSDHFIYTYAKEAKGDSSVLATVGKVLMTPPAILFDFVVQHSLSYMNLVRWLASGQDTDYAGPVAPEKKHP